MELLVPYGTVVALDNIKVETCNLSKGPWQPAKVTYMVNRNVSFGNYWVRPPTTKATLAPITRITQPVTPQEHNEIAERPAEPTPDLPKSTKSTQAPSWNTKLYTTTKRSTITLPSKWGVKETSDLFIPPAELTTQQPEEPAAPEEQNKNPSEIEGGEGRSEEGRTKQSEVSGSSLSFEDYDMEYYEDFDIENDRNDKTSSKTSSTVSNNPSIFIFTYFIINYLIILL
jgi:recombination DNA repair RAD52 pathway protein